MRFLTLSNKLSSNLDSIFNNFVYSVVGLDIQKSVVSNSTLEKSFKHGIKSQYERFSGIYSEDEFITLDLLRSYTHSALVKTREDFKHKINTLIFRDKSSTNINDYFLLEAASEIVKSSESPFSRIVSTCINDSYQEGRAAGIRRSFPGTDPYVYKKPRKDACNFCKSLYLKKDEIIPVVFKLSDMVEAGINNDGRHHHRPENTAWKAVIGSAHPWCRCTLHKLKKNYSFDEKGNVVLYKSKTFYW